MDRLAYTPDQLAEQIGIPVATIKDWRSRGRGPRAVRIGRHVRYLSRDLEIWLDSLPDPRVGRCNHDGLSAIAGQSGAGPVRNGAQNATQQATVEQHAHTCAACGIVGHTDNDTARPAGWIRRDNKTLCVACSYVS